MYIPIMICHDRDELEFLLVSVSVSVVLIVLFLFCDVAISLHGYTCPANLGTLCATFVTHAAALATHLQPHLGLLYPMYGSGASSLRP